jgi:hypothetical protein
MKTDKILIVILLMLASVKTYCQDSIILEIPKKKLIGLVPEYQQAVDIGQLKNKITIYNGYNRIYKIFVSKDQQNWFALSMPTMQYAIFKQKKFYAKILSSKSSQFIKELNADWIYGLHYNTWYERWEIVEKQEVRDLINIK